MNLAIAFLCIAAVASCVSLLFNCLTLCHMRRDAKREEGIQR